jgi:hypothetical protein
MLGGCRRSAAGETSACSARWNSSEEMPNRFVKINLVISERVFREYVVPILFKKLVYYFA